MAKLKEFINTAYEHALEMGLDYDEADQYVKESVEHLLKKEEEDEQKAS
jgi:hypothetical protein